MLIPSQGKGKRKLLLGISWLSLLISILILFSVAIFANHQQTLAANAVTTMELQNSQPDKINPVQENKKTTDNTGALAATPSIWPASGAVTSGFGQRSSPWEDGSELHPGIDIAVDSGTPVVATADGEVVKSGLSGGYGNIVQISHGNGIETIYGHNSKVAVSAGQTVKKGQIISYAGSTGRSTGPHVHYEIRVNGTAVDPIKFLVLY